MVRFLGLVFLAFLPVFADADTGMHPTAGRFLVATPDLVDPNFRHTVILMLEHDEQGAVGLVINRRLGIVPIQALVESMGKDAINSEAEIGVHIGGPVQSQAGFVVHTPDRMLETSKEVAPGIAVTSDPAMLDNIANGRGPDAAIATFGYAGWAPGQLEAEIVRGSWIVTEADSEIIFDLPIGERWSKALQSYGIDL